MKIREDNEELSETAWYEQEHLWSEREKEDFYDAHWEAMERYGDSIDIGGIEEHEPFIGPLQDLTRTTNDDLPF